MQNKAVLIIIILVVAAIAVALFFWSATTPPINLLPSMPTSTPATIPGNWLEKTYATSSANFYYPPTLGTTYIRPVDWPPALQVLNQVYSCTAAGNQINRAGQTTEKNINGHTYCVTVEAQGAAGSIYRNYAYAKDVGGKEAILTFSLQFPQCVNYDSPKKEECQSEESAFNIDSTIDQIFNTLKLQ